MLYLVVLSLLLSPLLLVYNINAVASSSCAVDPLKERASKEKLFKGKSFKDKNFKGKGACQIDSFKEAHNFQGTAQKKIDEVLNNKEFQAFVDEASTLKGSFLSVGSSSLEFSKKPNPSPTTFSHSTFSTPSFYVFVSFSLGEKALMNLAEDAKRWGATLVLRGFKEGSYRKTVKALQHIIQKTGQGVLIDPELFTLFAITAVPTFVLSKPFPVSTMDRIQTSIHDRLQGHVSIQYVLEAFAKEGDLREEAQTLLLGGFPR